MELNHPLPDGSKIIINVVCRECHLDDDFQNHVRTRIGNHQIVNGNIVYTVLGGDKITPEEILGMWE